MSKRDVFQLTVSLAPVTRCEPPDGVSCPLAGGTTKLTAAGARRHAADCPGHYVMRDEITRTSYVVGES